ncbi:AAA family ATPase [Rhodosalinus sp. 5P4]|uniref:AAA family ATPase n=1 Tax=Rhodosalinus sp. 5P4 TaxID=3239196 RepID=UPI003524C1B8
MWVNIDIPGPTDKIQFVVAPGESVVLVGANGAGKTRLGVHIERQVKKPAHCHRIAAQRALTLNTKIPAKNLETALRELHYGHPDSSKESQKEITRWQNKPATALLNDYDKLLAALFADETEVSVRYRQEKRRDPDTPEVESKLDLLKAAWDRLLPHKQLDIGGNNLKIKASDSDHAPYDAGELSDGERVIFYMFGQTLLSPENSLIIIDEPELHINRAILAQVYDEIEALRSDCAFIYITHDLDFAVTRQAAKLFALKSCMFPNPRNANDCRWDIQKAPENTDLDEELVAAIVGSRRAILFTEGQKGSLDAGIYRWAFPELTLIPCGSASAVIHAVTTFNRQVHLHRYKACGIVDFDHRTDAEVSRLSENLVRVLDVSEAENLLLLPHVLIEAALCLHHTRPEAETIVAKVKAKVIAKATDEISAVALRKTKRHIDTLLKQIDFNSKDITEFDETFTTSIKRISPVDMANSFEGAFTKYIEADDYQSVIREFDSKSLVEIAAQALGLRSRKELQDFIGRILRSREGENLAAIIRDCVSLPGLQLADDVREVENP